jgi:hypothetical protein
LEKNNLEQHNKEIQIQNNNLKKQLTEFTQKNNVTDFVNDIRYYQDSITKKEQQYQKITNAWNELCDKMEDIISENRLLRKLAKVPENFGINMEEIKIGERKQLEDYKAKIKILQQQIDELETERAQLKHKNVFLSSNNNNNIFKENNIEIPFDLLSKEEKKIINEYALALYEKKEFIIPERYELVKENQKLNDKIEFLEKQIQTIKFDNSNKLYNNSINNNQVKYIIN